MEKRVIYIHLSELQQASNTFFTTPNFAKFMFNLRLKKTIQKVDSIMENAMAIKNTTSAAAAAIKLGDSVAASSSSRQMTGHVVGLDDDLLSIMSRLCQETSNLQIIPIVGMGGIGKTTLARNAYDDPFITEHFDIRAWVTVSQDHSMTDILSTPNEELAQTGELAGLGVFKTLKYRRYLIVLDDMWSTEAWDDVSRTFPDDGNGSRIMLTTRLADMASYPDNFNLPHQMRLMDADHSWDLLKAKVFENQDFCPPELEGIGKKIAESCEGLPLAIVVIGGLHNLVRDLCIRRADEEGFLANLWGSDVRQSHHRRLSNVSHLPKRHCSTIRTIKCFRSFSSSCSLKGFKLLRLLIVGVACDSLPSQLFKLYHLRLLAMVYSKRIPSAIANLRNLQTLIILEMKKKPRYVARLPQGIWKMPQLRHVVYHGRLPPPERKGAAPTMENLQTLSPLPSFMCTEKVMKMIPNVKKLKILCYEYSANLNNLVHLHQLENLELYAASSCRLWQSGDELTLPKRLKKLTLNGQHLPWRDMTKICSLPNLQVLKLRSFACYGETWETSEGGFPQLEFLLIEESDLEQIITQSSHFPKLRSLVLHHCRKLIQIPDDIGDIETLELIQVTGRWKKSVEESAKRIREEQQSYGNDVLQVRFSSLAEQSSRRICF